jgi:hypothetical protein
MHGNEPPPPVIRTRGYKMGELLTRGAVLLETAAVRKLTEDATHDDYMPADYWAMYLRVRGDMSLSKLEVVLKEHYDGAPSKAELSRFDRGEVEARRCLKQALRAADGKPLLPDTVADVVTEHVHPDAKVFFLGDNEVCDVVLLVGDLGLWNVYNGPESIERSSTTTPVCIVDVPAGTRAQRRYYRPCLSGELKDLIEDSGESVEELLRYALEMKRREL